MQKKNEQSQKQTTFRGVEDQTAFKTKMISV